MFFYYRLGHCHLLLGHTEQAIGFLTKGASLNPRAPGNWGMLAAALALKGDMVGAQAALAELVKRKPEMTSLAKLSAQWANWNASPQYDDLRRKTVDVGLRRAGLSEK